MRLAACFGKDVIINTVDGKTFSGRISDYIEPIHNENGQESIVIDDVSSKYPIELYWDDIDSIRVL